MTERGRRPGGRARYVAGAMVGISGVVAGVIGLAPWAERVWFGEPYPVADPAARARQMDQHTQAIYDALGLPQAALDDTMNHWTTVDPYVCYRRGLAHLMDNLNDSPPSEPHVATITVSWTLKGVPRAQAVDAMQRAREQLTRQGWTDRGYVNSGHELQVNLMPPSGDDTVTIEANPSDRLAVTAHADCARYAPGTRVDADDQPDLPVATAPAPLRK
jgi:hypothetical protein